MDEAYYEMVKGLSVYPEVIDKQHDLKIVYTPIHGTGITLVPEVLKRFGFTNVHLVDEQITPDGNFPTVVYPNPEESEAMSIGLKKAEEVDAEIEVHRIRLMSLYADMEHTIKEINYTKQVIQMLEKGSK